MRKEKHLKCESCGVENEDVWIYDDPWQVEVCLEENPDKVTLCEICYEKQLGDT